MNIVKGDTVYIRGGKDVASEVSRLRKALGMTNDEEKFREKLASMPMSEQIAEANNEPGVRGTVLRVLPKEGKVVVEGVNMVTKHQRPRQSAGAAQVQQGGRIQMEAPLPVSRVMLVCPHCNKPTRVGRREVEAERQTLNGLKTVKVRERVCKQCGEVIIRPTGE